jgi:hypothetical protein
LSSASASATAERRLDNAVAEPEMHFTSNSEDVVGLSNVRYEPIADIFGVLEFAL